MADLRRDFELPKGDVLFLDSLGNVWEAIMDGNGQAVVIRQFSLPDGLVPGSVDLMIRVPPHYPVAALDMFYLAPGVSRSDRRPIPQLVTQNFAGRSWQRWSRHRVQGQQWRAGIDNLATHMHLVQTALHLETAKVA